MRVNRKPIGNTSHQYIQKICTVIVEKLHSAASSPPLSLYVRCRIDRMWPGRKNFIPRKFARFVRDLTGLLTNRYP